MKHYPCIKSQQQVFKALCNLYSIHVFDNPVSFMNAYPKWLEGERTTGKYKNLPYERFIILNDKCITAIDNKTGDCWTEDFETIEQALQYLIQ